MFLTRCSGSTCWRKTRTGRLKSVQKTERRNQQWTKLTLIHYDYLIVLDNRFNIRISHLRKMAGNMAEKVYRQNGRKSLQAKNFHNKMHYALVALAYSSVKPSTSSHIKFTGNCPLESKKSNLWYIEDHWVEDNRDYKIAGEKLVPAYEFLNYWSNISCSHYCVG